MNTLKPSNRRRIKPSLQAEGLETRSLLTGGAGSTFAIIQATITTPGTTASIPFTLDSTHFTLNKQGSIVLGIDVAAQTSSTIVPHIVGVEDMTTKRILPVTHATYSKAVQQATPSEGKQTTAVTLTLRPWKGKAIASHNYAVIVSGLKNSTGGLLVGFDLPGDANGDGSVNAADITLIKSTLNVGAANAKYSFAYDANRDGVINAADIRMASQNLGASTTINPVVAANLAPSSDSGLQDRITNIQTVNFNGTATPGALVTYSEAAGLAPTTTATADASGNYSLNIKLGNGSNQFVVTSIDAFGQNITGAISPVTYSLNAAASV